MLYNYMFDFYYEDISVEVILPTPKEHKDKKEAEEKANKMNLSFIVFPQFMVLSDGNNGSISYIDRDREYFKVSKMKDECKKRLGKLLSPDDINQLKEKGELESTIFSDAYMVNPSDDYKIMEWTIRELYDYLIKKWTPKFEYANQKGFIFESSSYGVKELDI